MHDQRMLGPELLPDWGELFPPFLARPVVRFHQRHRARHRNRADQSVNISNIRGPGKPWALGPTVIEELYISGPPAAGVGIFSGGGCFIHATTHERPFVQESRLDEEYWARQYRGARRPR